ncbi:MAG TPA: hypothetical protein PK283_02085 [Thiotrichales bacterium]|nr:hypothetical protein [Thiotrichales bacterium]HQR95326.1 hypothetical protein [Thiotrichales bacterium]
MLKIIIPSIFNVNSSNIGGTTENQQAFADGIVGTVSTATASDGSIQLTISGTGDALALLEMGATTLTVNNSQQPISKPISDWKSYFFSSVETVRNMICEYVPINGTHTILLNRSTLAPAQLGMLVYGRVIEVGDVQYGLSSELMDYSNKSTDSNGYVTLIKRGYGHSFTANIELTMDVANFMYQALTDLRATPLLFFDSAASLISYGFFKNIKRQINRQNYALLTIEVEGMQ